MSAQKQAQSFRNFKVEPLDWVAPDLEESDNDTGNEKPAQEANS
ncbi:MAG TPA: hypothetical protein VIR04_09675 [Paralcaligenes sp.]|jgi:hypothetical protein